MEMDGGVSLLAKRTMTVLMPVTVVYQMAILQGMVDPKWVRIIPAPSSVSLGGGPFAYVNCHLAYTVETPSFVALLHCFPI